MSSRRYELSDFEWSVIEPLLPNKPRGVPRVDDRRVLNGIYWRLRTGSPWAESSAATAGRVSRSASPSASRRPPRWTPPSPTTCCRCAR